MRPSPRSFALLGSTISSALAHDEILTDKVCQAVEEGKIKFTSFANSNEYEPIPSINMNPSILPFVLRLSSFYGDFNPDLFRRRSCPSDIDWLSRRGSQRQQRKARRRRASLGDKNAFRR